MLSLRGSRANPLCLFSILSGVPRKDSNVGHDINGATQHSGSQSAFSGIVFNLLPKAQGQLRPKILCCSKALRDLTISILMSK